MVEALVKANEIERLITPIFGNREITAVVAGQNVTLTVNAEFDSKYRGKSVSNELYGILEGTDISSYKFAESKKYEKELEEEKFHGNKA
jgi:hypothetical protein